VQASFNNTTLVRCQKRKLRSQYLGFLVIQNVDNADLECW
jgi:hypothetical protein